MQREIHGRHLEGHKIECSPGTRSTIKSSIPSYDAGYLLM